MIHKSLYIIATLLSYSLSTTAQENAVYVDNLKTIQVVANGKWGEPPVILLGAGNRVDISFDDLQHNYVRYSYSVTHCNADWTPSDLSSGEYKTGFDMVRIEDYEQSMNTEMLYNHYSITLPNDDVSLLLSGNYKVDIFEDGDEEPVATACFSIVEPKVGISANVTGNTDIDSYSQHQQMEMEVNYNTYPTPNPQQDFKAIVLQNRRWDNAVTNIVPTYLGAGKMTYSHNRSLIFEAGNEYRRMEILDPYVPTMRVESMSFQDPYFHANIMTDYKRRNYMFDKDQNGRYVVRNSDNVDNETESDYFITHFTLEMPQIAGGSVYLNGDLTNNRIAEEYRMTYNVMSHCYELVMPVKQGSYNYQYLYVRDGESRGQTIETEGNFHQTENEYLIYIYHRAFGERYDRLVGFKMLHNS